MEYEHPDKINRHPISKKTSTNAQIKEMKPTKKLITEWNDIIKCKKRDLEND